MSEFPVDTFKDAAQHLRRPFTAGAVKFKIQSTAGDRAMIVSHVDARLVIERLNLVIPDWYDEYERLDGKWFRCRLTVAGITREDVGTGNDPKAMYSDSLKRAGVKFGIGVSCYAMRRLWLPVKDGKDGSLGKQNNKPIITPDAETHLRGLYEGWLDLDRGGKLFGAPLDHGDAPEGSVGELADAPGVEPEQQELGLTPKEEEAHKDRIRALWAEVDWKRLPARQRIAESRLNQMLSGSDGNGDLEKVEQHVKERAGRALAAMRAEVAP